MPWWGWVLVGWTALSLVVAPLVGLTIRTADRRERALLGELGTTPRVAVARRRIPLPPVAFVLLLVGVGLETVGFVIRATGNEQGAARAWAMDLPLSVPRMFVAALFAVAALAAFAGAVTTKRSWWTGVGVVAMILAEVKGGGTVHVRVLESLGLSDHPVLAAAGSALVVGVVLAALWVLSRADRRDRRRMLLALAVYAVAAVGLSGISSVVSQAGADPFWQAAATYVEESGEALGAVAVLVSVLVGVAPRLVLPAEWALRRQADAQTVDAPGVLGALPAPRGLPRN